MRVYFVILLVACLSPTLLAFVARVPYLDRPEYGALRARDTDDTGDSHNATSTNATNNATDKGNSTSKTTATATPVPTLESSNVDEDNETNATAPGQLPVKPAVTPALGVGGFILLATGAILALIGVRNLWVQVFLSSAFLTSLGVTVLIVYVMSPPVRDAIQGAYLVAIFFTGITFGALAIVFKELAEGLGCLLGGFCVSMWLLSTKSGGLITATDTKAGFIGAISVGFYAVSFSHYTRDYGLIGATSIAGGTAIALGIDCYSKAGLKEFWLYLWALNDDIFPLGTNTYPVTRYMKVELAVVVIVAVMGVISQLRLWKVVRQRRLKDEEKRQEEQRKKDEAETEAAKRLEEHNMKERMEWEAKYGDNVASSETSTAIPELAAGSQTGRTDDGNLKEKDDAGEKKSISDSVVSYRCSECRAQGDCDTSTDTTGDTKPQNQDNVDETDRNADPSPDTEAPGGGLPKCLHNMAVADDRSSGVTAIVGSETMSVYSKRLSMLSKKASVKSNTKHLSESQEELIARDGDSMSTIGVADDVNDVDSNCHTIAGDSHYQAMLDEEQPAAPTEKCTSSQNNKKCEPENGESAANPVKEEAPQALDSPKPEEPQDKEVASKECKSNVETRHTEQPAVKESGNGEVESEKKAQVDAEAQHVGDSMKAPAITEEDTQKVEQHSDTVNDNPQTQQGEATTSECNERGQATEKPTEMDQASEFKNKGNAQEALQPDKELTTEPGEGESAEKGHEAAKKPEEPPSSEKPEKKKEEPKRLNAETVEQIPKHTSRVIQAHRMNEWAKHLTDADIPELEPIEPFEEQRSSPAEQEESAAPVKVTELLQTPLNAQPPPAVEPRVAPGQETSEENFPYDSRTGSQTKKRRSKSPRRLSGLSVSSSHSLAQNLPPAVQLQLGNLVTTSSATLLPDAAPAEQGYEESEKTKPQWKGPAPLIAVREDMMRNRLSSVSLPTDPYARHSTAQSPPDYSARYPSTFPIAEEDDDDIPLSQRRTMLHQQGSPISPIDIASTPKRWSSSGVPSRANSPAVLAAWRESVREDLKEKRNPLRLTTGGQSASPTPMGPGERSSTPFNQLGQRNVSSPGMIGDKIAEGMQRGDMSELHREAMRRMQAKANKSVNRLTGSKDVIKSSKPVAISGYGPPAADPAIPSNRREVIGEACARSFGALRLVPRFKSFLVHCPRAPFRPPPANQRRPRPSLFAPSLLARRPHSCQSSPLSVTTASPPSPSLPSSAIWPPSPAKTAQSRRFRDLPIISSPQIKEPAPSHPPPRVTLQSPQAQFSRTRTSAPSFERLEVETEAPPSRTRSSRLQKRWAAPNILRPPAVRLANPVNYVPRNTPVAAPNPLQASSESLPLESHRDAFPLLTIPERRRSRLTPSPNSLVVERSQQESESGRSSIAVPRGQRQSGTFDDIPLDMEATVDRPTHSLGTEVPRHIQSQHSLRSQTQIASIPSNSGAPNEPDVAEELAWGPAHPCFPHINPHVPPGSDEYMTTRIIRVRRDWMVKGDLAPTYSNLYPEILDPLLPEHEFRKIIAMVNDELISAFNPYSFRNWIDGAIGLITGWIWEDLGAPGVKGHLRRLEDWLEKWNREVGAKDGVRIWSLRRTGYMSLDIQIPDPKVGIVPSEGNPSRPGTRPESSGV